MSSTSRFLGEFFNEVGAKRLTAFDCRYALDREQGSRRVGVIARAIFEEETVWG